MNMNPGHFTTYKSLSPVLRTQTTCNLDIFSKAAGQVTDTRSSTMDPA